MSIFDSFSPNTIPYWSKRSIGHCLRDNNKARFLEFRQQATAYLFSDTLQGEFADQEFTLDLADKSDKAHNDFMNCMS